MDPAEAKHSAGGTGVLGSGLVLLCSGMSVGTTNNGNNVVTRIFFRSVKYWKRNGMEVLGNLL